MRAAVAGLVAVVSIVVVGAASAVVPSAPVGAEPLPLELAMVPGQGSLTLRDAEESTVLPAPLTLEATVDDATGVLSGGNFAATPVEFVLPVPEFNTTAFVTATFTQLDPGTATGRVSLDDDVQVDVRVKVDLHIVVGSNPVILTADCVVSPIALRLESVEPFDREAGRVTLADDFSVPAITEDHGSCIGLVWGEVNEALAGGGHRIELVMEGEIPEVQDIGTYPTSTALSVDPASAREGKAVTLTAQVAKGTAADPPATAPTGLVDFRGDGTLLAQVPIDDTGKATFISTELPLGQHTFSAFYRGNPDYAQSTSTTVNYVVAASPTVSIAMADTVLIGGLPRNATITVTNPAEFGLPLEDTRLDFAFARINSPSALLRANRLTIEWLNGSTWEPITVTDSINVVSGSIPVPDGISLDPGEKLDIRIRVAAPALPLMTNFTQCTAAQPTCPGPVNLTGTLNQLDGPGGAVVEALASDADAFTLVENTRRESTLTFLASPRPHTVRQGYAVEFITRIAPFFGGINPNGTVQVFIDGLHAGSRATYTPFEDGYVDELPIISSVIQGFFMVPPDFDPGVHQVTIRYSGDLLIKPAEVTSTFTVLPGSGHPFVCRSASFGGALNEWGALLDFAAEVPASAPAGGTVEFDLSSAVMRMNRLFSTNPLPTYPNNATFPVGDTENNRVTFGFGASGQGSAMGVTRANGTPQTGSQPAPEDQVDQTITFEGATATVAIPADAQPGETVPVALDDVTMRFILPGAFAVPLTATCVPVDQALPLGEIQVAGTTVTATPNPARETTDEVTIEAETFPADAAGTVSFSSSLDGNLGSDAVSSGVAELSTDGLSPGRHVVTAAFNATDPGVPDTQGTVTIEVQYSPRTGTQAFVVAARTDYTGAADEDDVLADAAALSSGQSRAAYLNELSRSDAYLTHVVNGMYVDTLGREGEAGGVEFWIGRLRAGWSVARVAASFYSSEEYFARVGGTDEAWVGDLYGVLLGRAPDTAGQDFWVARVATHGRDQVALSFFQTPESARARVVALYDRFLGRQPSAADRDFWAARVIARGDLILAVELTLSDEYDQRARTRFPLV